MTRETNIHWPEDVLGCPLRASYAREQRLRYSKLEVDDGPPRFRLTSDEDQQEVSVAFVWTEAQLAAFEQFHDEALVAGAQWFHFPMLTGDGMVDCYAHMLGGWTLSPVREVIGRYEVTFKLLMFRTPETQPPLLVLSDPFDALEITQARPADIVDAGEITAPTLPADVIDAMAPEVWP